MVHSADAAFKLFKILWLLLKPLDPLHTLFEAGADKDAESILDDHIGASANDHAGTVCGKPLDDLRLDHEELVGDRDFVYR